MKLVSDFQMNLFLVWSFLILNFRRLFYFHLMEV